MRRLTSGEVHYSLKIDLPWAIQEVAVSVAEWLFVCFSVPLGSFGTFGKTARQNFVTFAAKLVPGDDFLSRDDCDAGP